MSFIIRVLLYCPVVVSIVGASCISFYVHYLLQEYNYLLQEYNYKSLIIHLTVFHNNIDEINNEVKMNQDDLVHKITSLFTK